MPTNVHPLASDLLKALRDPDGASITLEHLDECLACRVRMSRVRHTLEPGPASTDLLQRIIEASTPLPGVLASLISGGWEDEPRPNEIWRVGRSEAMLVWVRHNFDDGVADVIPLVLDIELADQQSVIIGADATVLATETAAMASLRTHIHVGAFLNKIGTLDISGDVNEVMAAVREARAPRGVRVGLPIGDDGDQRIEYRQALRDLLSEMSPSAWLATNGKTGEGAGPDDLEPAEISAVWATGTPGSMAFELARYNKVTRANPVVDFNLPWASLGTLSLCPRPRVEHYAADIAAIAARSGAEKSAVANLLRTTDAVTVLARRRKGSSTERIEQMDAGGLLVAARDRSEEFTELEESEGQTQALPGWLIRAVDRFWDGTMIETAFPRDLHLPILTNLPLAIVEITGLSVEKLDEWLRRRHLPQVANVTDRPLRGCLVAYRGVGLLFVDLSDDADQRRLTVAHEAAHFVIDHLIPRENVTERRPELLEVLDGDREPSVAERFDSLLADVPIGFHAHLLERDAHGGHLTSTTFDIEDRAGRLALELLAPLQQVLNEIATVGEGGIRQVLRGQFGLPEGVAIRYASHLRRYRPAPPRTLLEAIGMAPAGGEDAYSEDVRHREAES